MAFILSSMRDKDSKSAFEKYFKYLEKVKDQFPPSAWKIAFSGWYYDPSDSKSPHDSWLKEIVIFELSEGERSEIRKTSIKIKLLGAYHDGFIELHYPQVFSYSLASQGIYSGHRDWRYDEFRLSDHGNLIHEIEWYGTKETSRWLIEASDIQFAWKELIEM
jgi:hypothetical protein